VGKCGLHMGPAALGGQMRFQAPIFQGIGYNVWRESDRNLTWLNTGRDGSPARTQKMERVAPFQWQTNLL
jgi:hypothetical protein